MVGFLYAVFITSGQPFGVQLSTAMCSSQSKHLKPWSHIVGPISPCFMLSVSGLNIWPWRFASQQSIFWKRCLVASEFVDVSYPVGYVENFPNWSANGTWIVSSTQSTEAVTLQKASHSTSSSGFSSLQILADSIVLFLALRSGLVLIEITGSFIVRNLVPLVIPLSCCYNLCTTFCLVVIAFAMGGVPKLCSSSTLV
ncbi:unnamed protein product [Brassica napus]|uniref:(rape) hypothetical protein n=1 Tax=Brassica napus TaxID=3708 RepID=A0A816K222_BRANA|nr:unnamed protein product [Brassica napus]